MGKVVKKIVLTGGPCAGKSSSLILIEEYLKKKCYLVYTVQESATELINSGIKPFGSDSLTMVNFQDVILRYQVEKEKIVEEVAMNYQTDKEIIILYDRAILDNKAYITQNDFDKLLNKYNLKEDEILKKYDLIIHLETAAKNVGYLISNNKARSEDKEHAIELDNNTYQAWIKHNNLIKVEASVNFQDKQNCIIDILDKFC